MMRIHIWLNDETEKIINEKFGENRKGFSKYISELILKDFEDQKTKRQNKNDIDKIEMIKKINTTCVSMDKKVSALTEAFNQYIICTPPAGSAIEQKTSLKKKVPIKRRDSK